MTQPKGDGQGVLFLVPARGGSVRVPGRTCRRWRASRSSGTPSARPARGRRSIPAVRTRSSAARTTPTSRTVRASMGSRGPVPASRGPRDSDTATPWTSRCTPSRRSRPPGVTFRAAGARPADLPADRSRATSLPPSPGSTPIPTMRPWRPSLRRTRRHGTSAGTPGPLEPVGDPADHVLTGAFYVIAPDELRRERRFVVPGRTARARRPGGPKRGRGRAARPGRRRSADPVPGPVRTLASRPAARWAPGGCLVIAEAGVNHNGDAGARAPARRRGGRRGRRRRQVPDLRAGASWPSATHRPPSTSAPRAPAADGQREMLDAPGAADRRLVSAARPRGGPRH